MRFRSAVRLSLFLAVLAVPADALGSTVVRTSSVTKRVVVPVGHSSKVNVTCPPPAVAVNAAISRQGSGVVVQRSIPGKGSGDWAFRVAAAGSGSRAVSATLRCVRLEVPAQLSGVRLRVKTRSKPVTVPAGGTRKASLRCGNNWVGTGVAMTADGGGDARLIWEVPKGEGWNFRFENPGTAVATPVVAIRCLKQTVTARSRGGGIKELRFELDRPLFQDLALGNGTRFFLHSCDPGTFSTAAGFAIDPAGPIEQAISTPVRERSGRWAVRRARAGDRVRNYLACLRTGSRFH